MKNTLFRSLLPWNSLAVATLLVASTTHAAEAPFTEAKFTEVAGEVSVSKAGDAKSLTAAKINDLFHAPDMLHTGRHSRAQLTAADGTIARVGSNTVFSLEPASRTIHLTEGSILFNSPKGIGGGTIVTNSATATVTGTTIIVTATSDGGFKVLVLEGTASIKFPGGQTVSLTAGQMTFVLPPPSTGGSSGGDEKKDGTPGPVLNFDLAKLVASSGLVNGFTITLPSSDLILDATHGQQLQISSGNLQETGQIVVGAVGSDQVVLTDDSILQTATDAQKTPKTPDEQLPDLTLTTNSTIPEANIFDQTQTFAASKFNIPNGLVHNDKITVIGLIGGDVNFSGNVNLDAVDFLPRLDVLAAKVNTFTISGNTVLTGLTHPNAVRLLSAGSFNIAAGSDISTDFIPERYDSEDEIPLSRYYSFNTIDLELGSVGPTSLNNVSIRNRQGDAEVDTIKGDLTVANGSIIQSGLTNSNQGFAMAMVHSRQGNVSITGNSYVIGDTGDGGVFVQAGKNVTIANSTLGVGTNVIHNTLANPHTLTPNILTPHFVGFAGFANISANGNVSVTDSTIKATDFNVFGGALTLLKGTDVSSVRSATNVAGDTVVLKGLDFANQQQVNLWSATGLVNFGNESATPLAGYVNFLGEVTYGDGDPLASIGDLDETNIHLGITAANTGVLSALGQTLTLPADGVPEGLEFNEVLFTPANLNSLVAGMSDYDGKPFFFSGGIIVGTLNLSGNGDALGGDPVIVKNINLTGSANLTVYGGSELEVFLLGNLTTTGHPTLNLGFNEEEGNLNLASFPTLSLANFTLNNHEGAITLDGKRAYLPAINLKNMDITAEDQIELISERNGDILVTGSNLTSWDSYIDTYTGSNAVETLIVDSALEAEDSIRINNGEEEEGFDGAGIVMVKNSTLDGGEGTVHIIGSDITLDHSTLLTNDDGINLDSQSGGTISIQSSNLTAQFEVNLSSGAKTEAFAGDILIGSSNLTARDDIMDILGRHSLVVTNSTLASEEEMDLGTDGLLSVASSRLTSNDGDITLGANTITVANSTIEADGRLETSAGSLAVRNSTLRAGNLLILSASNSVNLTQSEADASGIVQLNATNVTAASSNFTASNVFASAGDTIALANSTIAVTGCLSLSGNVVTVQNSAIQSGSGNTGTNGYVGISGTRTVTIAGGRIVSQRIDVNTSPHEGSLIAVSGTDIQNATTVNMSSRTITLSDVNFKDGSTVNLNSQNGVLAPNPNTNKAPVVGDVNFIKNVNYGGQPAQNFVPVSVGGSSTLPSPPIHIGHNNI